MKTVIFCCADLSTIGGAERFILDTARALEADLVVLSADESVLKIYGRDVRIISLNKKIPGGPLGPIGSLAAKRIFEKIDFRGQYDFFIAFDHASMFALKKHKPNLFYCLGPRRELYDMYYHVIENQDNFIRKFAVKTWLDIYRKIDRNFVKNHIENIVCISHNVRNRVYKYYQKDAWVVYPPVHTDLYEYKPSEGYWLSVNRIDNWKRIDLQFDTFRMLPDKNLKIVGSIYETPKIKKMLANRPVNVELLGNISEKELRELYSRCEGVIATPIDEDYGLTPSEAMASGKPVVAVKEGGYLETVLDGVTGRLVAPRSEELVDGILEVSKNSEQYKDACLERAKLFDYEVFKKNIKKILLSLIS
jgi:glycosyltransferase involved in cell wall biosynthesis